MPKLHRFFKAAAAAVLAAAPSVRLDAASVGGTDTAPKWNQVAYEGHFRGHWMGEFEFTRKTFEQIVANFRRHPAYKAGAEKASAEAIEAGQHDVVQYDFHHASEQAPTEGGIPVFGAPAQAWALELDVRTGADGKAQLWALTRYLEPARTYVREGRYKWTSVSVVFDAQDPVTGESIGAVLTSIAITNSPFLQALPAIAASIYRDPWAPQTGDEQLLARLAEGFELDAKADAATIKAKVDELRAWAAPGATVPEGVDIAYAISQLRQMLNLPTLATTDEVFAELDTFFSRVSSPAPAGATNAATRQETALMDTKNPAAPQTSDLKLTLAMAIGKRRGVDPASLTDTQILLAVEQGAQASEDLGALLESLGAKGVKEALAKVAEAQALAAKFNQMMPEYDAMKKEIGAIEEQSVEEDVGMALATLGHPDPKLAPEGLRKSLSLYRKSDKAGFRKDYPREAAPPPPPPAHLAHLTQTIVAGPPGANPPAVAQPHAVGPLGALRLDALGRPSAAPAGSPQLGVGGAIDVTAFPGANLVQKTESYVRQLTAAKPVPYAELHRQAVELVRQKAVFARTAA